MKKKCLKLFKKSKNISIYVIGAVLIKGIHYLSTPIFTRVMTTAEYGVASMFTTWATIFSIFIAFQISGTIPSAYVKYENKLRSYISSALTLSIATFFVITTALFLLRGDASRYLQVSNVLMEHGVLIRPLAKNLIAILVIIMIKL